MSTETLIIGAGPAGLSCGYTLNRLNREFLIIEKGKSLQNRDRNDKFDAVAGVGGAGLFSDGKFSFFPSGTNIWKYPNQQILRESYSELANMFFESIGFQIPQFPNVNDQQDIQVNGNFELKSYYSTYINLNDRKQLIEHVTEPLKTRIILGSTVIGWDSIDEKYLVKVNHEDEILTISCKYIIMTGGRFFPLQINNVPKLFKRYEFGFRLVGDNQQFLKVNQQDLIDPKWIYKPTQDLEYRTFCMCKDGEYIQSEFDGFVSYSGRADVPPTGFTNFGLTMRIKTENIKNFQKVMNCGAFQFTLDEIMNDKSLLANLWGEELADMYMDGLQCFLRNFQLNQKKIKVVGPSIEGVGQYFDIDDTLKVKNQNLFVAGDCSGIFRGIIPSMLSGHIVALNINQEESQNK